MNMKDKDFEKFENILCLLLENSTSVRNLISNICKNHIEANSRTTNNAVQTQSEQRLEQLEKCRMELKKYKTISQQAVSKISNYEQEINELKSENSRFQNKKLEYESEIKIQRTNVTRLEKSIVDITEHKDKVQNLLDKVNVDIMELKIQIDTPIKYLDLYKKLPEIIRSGLSNVVIDTNVITFIVSCSNEDNLKAIWTYIKDIINDKYSSADINTLKNIFDYFFKVYNDSLSEPKYLRDYVELGDNLDDEFYDRGSGSSTSGPIKEIILHGYKSKNTGRIVCKSVVKA